MDPIYFNISLASEGKAISILSNRDFSELSNLPPGDIKHSFSNIEVRYCALCMNGFVSMTTYLKRKVRSLGDARTETKSRLVFSSALSPTDVKTIIDKTVTGTSISNERIGGQA